MASSKAGRWLFSILLLVTMWSTLAWIAPHGGLRIAVRSPSVRASLLKRSPSSLWKRTLDTTTYCRRLSPTNIKENISTAADFDLDKLSPGIPKGFYVVKQYVVPPSGFDLTASSNVVRDTDEVERLGLVPGNVSLPVALMLLDPDEFPSLSRARKACRKGTILIQRDGPTTSNNGEEFDTLDNNNNRHIIRGRVGDRVYSNDMVVKQVRMGNGEDSYESLSYYKEKPPFDLPVVYQDDHFAIVNKPAGVASRERGNMSVRAGLPFVLTPPKIGTYSPMRRPQPVHRLDKPTSGLLLVAKTKPAMVDLSRQFLERRIKKTYTAIVNGIPDESQHVSISSRDAFNMGVDVDLAEYVDTPWQLIDYALDEKEAVTVWRAIQYFKSLKAKDNTLTLVELKPKTGRYHQLRRHMAWACDRPLVGDDEYDGGGDDARALRERGLFLCSNRLTLEHPHYNTESGRKEWKQLDNSVKYGNGMLRLSDGKVMVHASIEIPDKFNNFLAHENVRAVKFGIN